MGHGASKRLGRIAALMARHAYLVVGVWIALAAGLNIAVPQLEKVVAEKSGPFIPDSAPSLVTLTDMGSKFGESRSTAIGYLVFEHDNGITETDRGYYRTVVDALRADPARVDSVQDLIGDPMTASIGTSRDGKAVYAFIRFHGGMGSAEAIKGQDFTQEVLAGHPVPAGLKVYLTGPAPTIGEEIKSEDHAVLVITGISVVMIVLLLLLVYRSIATVVVPLGAVGLALAVAKPLVATLAEHGGLEVSIFSVMLLAALILGGGTDYAIFFLSGYHEHRRKGTPPQDSIAAAATDVSGVIVASGLTVAASCAVMALTHIVLFRTVGLPCSIGVLVAVAAAVTLVPALTSILARRGFVEPRGAATSPLWRRVGIFVVRKPVIALITSLLVIIVLAAQVPWMSTGYNEQAMQAPTTTANRGYDAIARHFDPNELTPDYLVVEADHDLRNSADFSALNAMARALEKVPGVRAVRGPSQPEGTPVAEFTMSHQAGMLADELSTAVSGLSDSVPRLQRLDDGVARLEDGLSAISQGAGLATDGSGRISDGTARLQEGLDAVLAGSGQLYDGSAATADGAVALSDGIATAVDPILGLLDHLAPPANPCATENSGCAADDQLAAVAEDTTIVGQIRSALVRLKVGSQQLADGNRKLHDGTRQLRDGLSAVKSGSVRIRDGQTVLTNKLAELAAGARAAREGSARIADGIAQIPPQTTALIDGLTQARGLLQQMSAGAVSRDDAGFFVPRQAFDDPRFKSAMGYFLSKDGRTARFVVLGSTTAFSAQAIIRVDAAVAGSRSALTDTSLSGSTVRATGLAAGFGDLHRMVNRDFAVIAAAALLFIFLILAVLLRALVAPLYLIATIALSYLGALGITKLVWQDILGVDVYWAVPPLAFVALVAVGSDYNMLFMARIRAESQNGTRSGIIKAYKATGGVISTAGAIFALTMLALLASPTQNISQVGFTIGAGLLLDTFIVRALTVPAIAALLGPKTWWPQRSHPVPDAPKPDADDPADATDATDAGAAQPAPANS